MGEIGEALYQLERLGRLLGVNNLDGKARMHEDVIANVRAGRESQGDLALGAEHVDRAARVLMQGKYFAGNCEAHVNLLGSCYRSRW